MTTHTGSRLPAASAWREVKTALATGSWLVFLTFPIMVIRVNTVEKTISWRWMNLFWVGVGTFLVTLIWRYLLRRRDLGRKRVEAGGAAGVPLVQRIRNRPLLAGAILAVAGAAALALPWRYSLEGGFKVALYQTNILINALIYVMLGLGLNIVVGLAGLLDLGYVAFYAVGAYGYALLNHHYHVNFWIGLPLGGLLGALFGILLGFPVLRLRGDYLAIVTLGFGEIIRLVLENWNEFSMGPSGISGIDRPGLPGVTMSMRQATVFIYYLMIALTIFTVFVVHRLQNSRLGRAWVALREDETACQAMGVDKTRIKLAAFALGATWASMGGVVFAAKTTFINPASFTFMESAIILSIVVLGGMGSIPGVIIASLVMVLLPEYLRAFSQYRMLIFGAVMVLMMIFRPQGLISDVRRTYGHRSAGGDHGRGR